MLKFFLKTVPLSDIRHNDLSCYVKEGFGGAPIETWPIFGFYTEYVSDDKTIAKEKYVAWYKDQLEKYHNTSKLEGGMFKGSLYRFIEKECNASFLNVDSVCKQNTIEARVEQRFALLESIKKEGYAVSKAERIDGVHKNGYVYLTGGHHRAAVLKALGKTEIPKVLVFPNKVIYNLFYFIRNIKNGNF